MRISSSFSLGFLSAVVFPCTIQALDHRNANVAVDAEDGTVHVPAFSVPLSMYMSEQAKARFIQNSALQPDVSDVDSNSPGYVREMRSAADKWLRPKVEQARRSYPVKIEAQIIGGVRTHVVTPEEGVPKENKARVLVNLHAGGFYTGAVLGGMVESIPVASIGKIKVVTVDYRMAPEYKFPAASVDVAAVYRELLKEYDATNIGIYGCSAGGTLSAMAVAWFQKHDLPVPGAIGILSAAAFGNFYYPGVVGSWSGDSAYVAWPLTGQQPLSLNHDRLLPSYSYLREADVTDPLVSPALWQEVLAKFPPTLLMTGTRALDMSAAVQTHRELVKAGVEANLHLWDGMGHCFFSETDLPESREAYDVLLKFFDANLRGKPSAAREIR